MQAIVSKAEHVVLNQAHEAILQTLDRVFDGRMYRSEDFANAKDWDGIPAIFASEHPDLAAYDKDPQAELARIKGRIVGAVSKAHIETAGHPRLMGDVETEDDEVNRGIADGQISLSTGFYAKMAKDKDGVATTDGPVQPHHVLLFYEDRNNQPRDLGTGILNKGPQGKDGKSMPEEKKEPDMAPLLAELNKSKDELKAKDGELSQAKAEVAAKNQEIEALKNKIAVKEKAEADAKWEGLKNSYIPKGLVAKPEDEKALRELMDKDPVAFINKVEGTKVDLSGKGKDGVTNTGGKKTDPNKDEKQLAEDMNKIHVPSIIVED